MSSEIIDKFYNKDVRTEVKIEQQDSQQWPAITISPKLISMKYFACINNFSLFDLMPSAMCQMDVQVKVFENQQFESNRGCLLYNENGTLIHKGDMTKGMKYTIVMNHILKKFPSTATIHILW